MNKHSRMWSRHPATNDPDTLPRSWSSTAVRGYRSWAEPAVGDIGILRASHWPVYWTEPITHATCMKYSNKCAQALVPNPKCCEGNASYGCGIYAWHLPDEVIGQKPLGVVEGAGTVLWTKAGWRAEKARVIGLYHPHPGISEALAVSHPDTAMFTSPNDLLAAFPPLIDPVHVYGPQGAAIRRLVEKAAAVPASRIPELNQPWSWRDSPDCNARTTASNAAHRAITNTGRFGTPEWMHLHIACWAYRAVMVADRLPQAAYELLVAPWRSVFGDPLPEYTPPESSAGAVEAFPEASGPSGPKDAGGTQ